MLLEGDLDEELEAINLGDKRLDKRSVEIYKAFSQRPTSSINGSFGGWSEVKAAYNFFSNDKVTSQKLLEPHYEQTFKRMYLEEVILCIQDTTIIDYSHRKEVKGLGNLRDKSDQGFLMHSTIAVTPEGVCLGMLDNHSWVRGELKGKESRRQIRPVEEKESMRWIESYRRCECLAKGSRGNKLIINIADREGDFYELLQEYEEGKSRAHLIVRAKSDRVMDNFNHLKAE